MSDTQTDVLADKAADAALSYRMQGRYGSLDKAIAALAKRKGLSEVTRSDIERAFRDALGVMDAAADFAAQRPSRPYLSKDELPGLLDALEAYVRERVEAPSSAAIARARTWLYFAHAR